MRSLRSRILLSASLVGVVFLGLASLLLDKAFRDSARNAVEDRLKGRVFMLIGAADFDASEAGMIEGPLPDPSLSVPGSGNYARIFSSTDAVQWRSDSILGIEFDGPGQIQPGEWALEQVASSSGERLFSLAYAIIWEGAGQTAPVDFVIQACETEEIYLATVGAFRRSLWHWFAGLSIALLVVQAMNLNWGLQPLRRVVDEVKAVEKGQGERISDDYPSELIALTQNLNALIGNNKKIVQRHRDALGDLAHSIKTPLAVLRNEMEKADAGEKPPAVLEQLDRLDHTVEYQLHRAAAGGRSLMVLPVPVASIASRVAESLRKVYAERNLQLTVAVEAEAVFFGDEGDLFEILGNLADNACKWAASKVRIATLPAPQARTLIIEISDDGTGIPGDKLDLLLKRGGRLDSAVEGHGIGLAIVRELVEGVYGGSLEFESSASGTVVRSTLDFS